MKLGITEQIEIMETQLNLFITLIDKMKYMNEVFDPDPNFSKKARDIVRSNISKNLDN